MDSFIHLSERSKRPLADEKVRSAKRVAREKAMPTLGDTRSPLRYAGTPFDVGATFKSS